MFFADGIRASSFASAFSTHPPLKSRIKKIQPSWDGKVEVEKATVEERVAAAAPAQASTPSGSIPVKSQPDGRTFIEGMAILGAVGSLSSEQINTAKRITAEIPADLDTLMREDIGARQAIIALVMADNHLDDEAQWQVVEAALSAEECEKLRDVYQTIKEMPRGGRLAALELATTTLAQAHIEDKDDYMTLLNNLMQTDSQLTLYEFCIRRILRERLSRGGLNAQGSSSVHYMQLKPKVAKAVGNMLSIVAREASGARDPSDLMARSLKAQYLLNNKVAYEEKTDGENLQLDRSLDVLRSTAFAIRAQCLRSVVHIIRADGKLEPQEAEVLRMLSLSLDCPVPPIV